MCLLGWNGESFNIVERGQLCYSTVAELYTRVIDNGVNSSPLYREAVFFPLGFIDCSSVC